MSDFSNMTKIRNEKLILLFGANVRKHRQARSMSQVSLSDLANINRSQIIDIEAGRINTTISTANAIANALEINISELFYKSPF